MVIPLSGWVEGLKQADASKFAKSELAKSNNKLARILGEPPGSLLAGAPMLLCPRPPLALEQRGLSQPLGFRLES